MHGFIDPQTPVCPLIITNEEMKAAIRRLKADRALDQMPGMLHKAVRDANFTVSGMREAGAPPSCVQSGSYHHPQETIRQSPGILPTKCT